MRDLLEKAQQLKTHRGKRRSSSLRKLAAHVQVMQQQIANLSDALNKLNQPDFSTVPPLLVNAPDIDLSGYTRQLRDKSQAARLIAVLDSFEKQAEFVESEQRREFAELQV